VFSSSSCLIWLISDFEEENDFSNRKKPTKIFGFISLGRVQAACPGKTWTPAAGTATPTQFVFIYRTSLLSNISSPNLSCLFFVKFGEISDVSVVANQIRRHLLHFF
jgi:hypothetical protein